mmetsp:Transcript_10970/g.21476  ORF Transcript_10970/g.21476 Transcript_10970/m.21476 type:complete len:274 (+) Transcript_10970:904-1725(+)
MASFFRPDLLAGKKVFVTGGGTGIAKEIVLAFMQHGADVAIMGRRRDKLEEAKLELEQKTGRTCVVCPGNVKSVEEVKGAVDTAMTALGGIDILVNGAAGNFQATLDQLSYNAFRTVVETGLIGTFNVTKTVYERALKHSGGLIINISMTFHYNGMIGQSHSSASKAGIDALTKVFAAELGPRNIRVVGIAPGSIGETVGMDRIGEEMLEIAKENIPLGRLGTKLDVAQVALYVCAADYLHGHTLVIDGGGWLTLTQYFLLTQQWRDLWRGKL